MALDLISTEDSSKEDDNDVLVRRDGGKSLRVLLVKVTEDLPFCVALLACCRSFFGGSCLSSVVFFAAAGGT